MNTKKYNSEKFNIAMVSDFFYPNVGGVEGHIYELSQCLLRLGHKVIVITHAYKIENEYFRQGVRYFENDLKVFYVPFCDFYNQCCMPLLYATMPIFREIFIREQIQIVHSHSAFSSFALEGMLHAKTLKLHTVFTDHSLFGFADLSSVLMNKLLQLSLLEVDNAICVSHTSKENTVLRAKIPQNKVHVIPNAIHGSSFKPDPNRIDKNFITIVIVSRLVYRKGVDLLCGVIPELCARYPSVRFKIAGDGPKRVDLEEIRDKNNLYNRIEFLGGLRNDQIRDVLVQGDIFISPSLTEAFCIAIVEAACCGLKVVSTNVGGVCEVLPEDLITLCQATCQSLLSHLVAVINKLEQCRPTPEEIWSQHTRVAKLYTWYDVARRTQTIYSEILQNKQSIDNPLGQSRLRRHFNSSFIGGKIFAILILIEMILFYIINLIRPREKIEYLASLEED